MSDKKPVRLEHSELTDKVYVVSRNQHEDVTNDFLQCVLSRWAGYQQVVRNRQNGKQYTISVQEVKAND